jgi:hypothetical protein
MKLIIAMGDRYALGYWQTDAYALKYGIVQPGTSGAQQIDDASPFYTSEDAIHEYDNRLKRKSPESSLQRLQKRILRYKIGWLDILNHRNAKMGHRRWTELDEVIEA